MQLIGINFLYYGGSKTPTATPDLFSSRGFVNNYERQALQLYCFDKADPGQVVRTYTLRGLNTDGTCLFPLKETFFGVDEFPHTFCCYPIDEAPVLSVDRALKLSPAGRPQIVTSFKIQNEVLCVACCDCDERSLHQNGLAEFHYDILKKYFKRTLYGIGIRDRIAYIAANWEKAPANMPAEMLAKIYKSSLPFALSEERRKVTNIRDACIISYNKAKTSNKNPLKTLNDIPIDMSEAESVPADAYTDPDAVDITDERLIAYERTWYKSDIAELFDNEIAAVGSCKAFGTFNDVYAVQIEKLRPQLKEKSFEDSELAGCDNPTDEQLLSLLTRDELETLNPYRILTDRERISSYYAVPHGRGVNVKALNTAEYKAYKKYKDDLMPQIPLLPEAYKETLNILLGRIRWQYIHLKRRLEEAKEKLKACDDPLLPETLQPIIDRDAEEAYERAKNLYDSSHDITPISWGEAYPKINKNDNPIWMCLKDKDFEMFRYTRSAAPPELRAFITDKKYYTHERLQTICREYARILALRYNTLEDAEWEIRRYKLHPRHNLVALTDAEPRPDPFDDSFLFRLSVRPFHEIHGEYEDVGGLFLEPATPPLGYYMTYSFTDASEEDMIAAEKARKLQTEDAPVDFFDWVRNFQTTKESDPEDYLQRKKPEPETVEYTLIDSSGNAVESQGPLFPDDFLNDIKRSEYMF